MDIEKLLQIISNGENLTVEFKGEERSQISDDDIIETVVCLANRTTGETAYVLIGVEDDGRITGARPRHGNDIDPIRIQALIGNKTRPSLVCRVDVVQIKNKPVIVIEVPKATIPVSTSTGLYKRRALNSKGKPECLPYHYHEMQSFLSAQGILDYSRLVVNGATWEDLDPLEFERFRRFIRDYRGDSALTDLSDLDIAKALGAVETNGEVKAIKTLGLLLFGKEESLKRLIPTHEVAFQVFDGDKVVVNDFFYQPLLNVMENLLLRFRARNRQEEAMLGLVRIGIPDYSERSFREAVANALIHRDYTRIGTVFIQWHDDWLEISNPGGFPEGITLQNLLVTPPKPRNPLLADAFKRIGIVERTGRGIDIIFLEQLRNGRPLPSYERSSANEVILNIPGGKANLEFVRFIIEENQHKKPLTLDELLILNKLWYEKQIATKDASSIIQKSESEALIILNRLCERGLVEGKGSKKGRIWHFSASVYRKYMKLSDYIHLRGFEPIQLENMVLQYLEKNKFISRKEVVDLCRINEAQAYRLLKKLEQEGKIIKVGGKTKGVKYQKSSY